MVAFSGYKPLASMSQPMLCIGQVIGYVRKSTDDEGASKSLEDQTECVLETSEAFGLPLTPGDVMAEPLGKSGCLWWSGGGGSGIEGDENSQNNVRPILTEIVRGVVAGRIKAIVVWSLDRLWRDVGICEAMIKLLSKHNCLLFDRNGPVDISTPDGRTSVRSNAVAAQNLREMAAVNAPRGVQRSRKKGKLVTQADRLGFRAVGAQTGQVRHIPQEQALVRRIFTMFVVDGITPTEIARQLTREGSPWIVDAFPRRIPQEEGKPVAIYRGAVISVLQDCRYQGRQPHGKLEFNCPVFLQGNGEPVVPTALYEAAQAKLTNFVRGKRPNSRYSLSHLICCGQCAQPLIANRSLLQDEHEAEALVGTWVIVRNGGFSNDTHWCTHRLPVLQRARVEAYLQEHLLPLLIAELRERASLGENVALQNERGQIQRDLAEAERKRREELPKYLGKISPELLADMERDVVTQISDLKVRLRDIDVQLSGFDTLQQRIHNMADLTEEAKNDLYTSVFCWVAVVPSNLPSVWMREAGEKKGQRRPNPDQGRLVFLTRWGTMHSAVIYRGRVKMGQKFTCYLRPATFEEALGTVNDLPDIDAFIQGIERSHKGRRRKFYLQDMMPGLQRKEQGDTELPVFDTEE